jgi:L-alanine-DL-glutamate epimerase-like enolase superfamily enzyme
MKLTRLETIRLDELPNLLWVRLHTDSGHCGLGETFFGAAAVEAYLHETAAAKLAGADPLAIERIAQDLVGYLGFGSAGAEVRGDSAIDIALWDLFGRVTGLPVWQLLGGRCRERIRTYNTCAGPGYYAKGARRVGTENHGEAEGRYEDLTAFLTRADRLAEELLASGITAMKIWPFDEYAEKTGGAWISEADLARGLEPVERIRKAVGDRIDVMLEFHSMWRLEPAIRIAEALAPYRTYWHEDPLKMDNFAVLKRYAERSRAPVCASETLSSRARFRELLLSEAAGVIMLDLSWCGGLTEARKIAILADAWQLPVAPHDCTGPVVLTASTHLSLHAPNALIQESVRAYYDGWYRDLVTALPAVSDGCITVPDGPGLGLELRPDLDRRFTVRTRSTELA